MQGVGPQGVQTIWRGAVRQPTAPPPEARLVTSGVTTAWRSEEGGGRVQGADWDSLPPGGHESINPRLPGSDGMLRECIRPSVRDLLQCVARPPEVLHGMRFEHVEPPGPADGVGECRPLGTAQVDVARVSKRLASEPEELTGGQRPMGNLGSPPRSGPLVRSEEHTSELQS